MLRLQPFDGLHGVQRTLQFAMAVEDDEIGAGGSRAAQRQRKIDTRRSGCLAYQPAIGIIAQHGEKRNVEPKPRQVLGNVAGNTAHRHRHLAGVRRRAHEGAAGPALDVNVRTADDNDARHGDQKSVGAPPSALRRSTKALSSSFTA